MWSKRNYFIALSLSCPFLLSPPPLSQVASAAFGYGGTLCVPYKLLACSVLRPECIDVSLPCQSAFWSFLILLLASLGRLPSWDRSWCLPCWWFFIPELTTYFPLGLEWIWGSAQPLGNLTFGPASIWRSWHRFRVGDSSGVPWLAVMY